MYCLRVLLFELVSYLKENRVVWEKLSYMEKHPLCRLNQHPLMSVEKGPFDLSSNLFETFNWVYILIRTKSCSVQSLDWADIIAHKWITLGSFAQILLLFHILITPQWNRNQSWSRELTNIWVLMRGFLCQKVTASF